MATNYNLLTWNNSLTVPIGSPYGTPLVLPMGSGTAGAETITFGSTNDTYRLIRLPKRVCIADALWQLGDHDSGTALVLTLRVTDGTTTKTIIHQASTGQAGGIIRPTKIPTTEDGVGFTTTSESFWLEVLVSTQATGAQAAISRVIVTLTGAYPPGTAGTE